MEVARAIGSVDIGILKGLDGIMRNLFGQLIFEKDVFQKKQHFS